ncbi:HTH-type transcriptional regulator HdfR [Streptomyces antimycoticus]
MAGERALDVRQLKALVTVAEVGSVTRAAELLHLVQPAVTRQIRTLEEELGVPLFERTRQGMRPTEAGAIMADRARRALNELERARAEVQPTPGVVTGIVTVGLLESTTDLLAEPLVSRSGPGPSRYRAAPDDGVLRAPPAMAGRRRPGPHAAPQPGRHTVAEPSPPGARAAVGGRAAVRGAAWR